MHLKRVAGVINLVAAVVFITAGATARPMKGFFIAIGVVFLLIGIVRLRQTRPGPPAS
jgi:hypothetical protein